MERFTRTTSISRFLLSLQSKLIHRVLGPRCVWDKKNASGCICFPYNIISAYIYICFIYLFAAVGYQINNSFYSCSGFDPSSSTFNFEQSMRSAAFSGMYTKPLTHTHILPHSLILIPPACARSQTAGVCIQWGFSDQGGDGVQHRGLQVGSLWREPKLRRLWTGAASSVWRHWAGAWRIDLDGSWWTVCPQALQCQGLLGADAQHQRGKT